jgi:hypothetical protein
MSDMNLDDSNSSSPMSAEPVAQPPSPDPVPPTPPAPAPQVKRPGWLSRVLWASGRVAEARRTTYGPGKPGFEWYALARQLGDELVKLGENRRASWAALMLECSEIGYLVRAYLERAGHPTGTCLGEVDWQKVHELPETAEAWAEVSPHQLSLLNGMLGGDRDIIMARLSEKEREVLAISLHQLADALSAPLHTEANRLGLALVSRWTRVAVMSLVVAIGLGFGVNWAARKFAGPNIALNKTVTVSSQFPWDGKDPSKLVDGDPDNMGFHTNSDGQQWVVIDLGSVRKFDKIVVYNRPEYQERAVPLKVEVSTDGQNYKEIAERKETFDKWKVKGLNAQGRYVRFKNPPNTYLHLSEVEIY